MPFATRDGVSLYYEARGRGDSVLFLGDVGLGAWQWGWQHAALTGPSETVVMDTRGCGRSDAPPGDCSAETLARDAGAVLKAHGVASAHVVGAGLGGMAALELARETGRVQSLTLVGTAADGRAYDPEPLFADPTDRAALRESLTSAFSAEFVAEQPDVLEQIAAWRADEDASRADWERQAAALSGFEVSAPYEITEPALVVHGEADRLCSVDAGEALADDLPRGEFFPVEGAGHFVHVEASKPVNDRLLAFLDEA